MKKKLFALLTSLLILFSFSVCVYAQGTLSRLVDDANLLSNDEKIALSTRLDEVSEKYKVDFVIVTVETVGAISSDQYVEDCYDSAGYGFGESKDGIILLVAMEEREYRILSNGLAAKAISSYDIDAIGDLFSPYLTDGEYAKGFYTFVDECEYEVSGEINGFPFAAGRNLLISLGVGLVLALIVTGIWKGQLKTVRKQNNATEYTKSGSMQVSLANDLYLYSTVTRHAKPQNNNSRSGGSSRNVGGGSF